MRITAALLTCLLVGTAPAIAQSGTEGAVARAALTETLAPMPAGQPVDTSSEQATAAAEVKAEEALVAAARQEATPVKQAVEQPVGSVAPQGSMKPAEPTLAASSEQAAAAAEIKTAETRAIAAQPVAKPVKQATIQPAGEPTGSVTPAAVTTATKPAIKTADAACPGHPDALGTERVLTISPSEFQDIGVINYKQTLPLKDHEVVLTFDDGPIPPYTNSVLDTLAANCVKATYFLVGEMARLRPYLVRRIYNDGHSIGTHSQTHPFAFQRLSMARVEREVDGGIASVDNALGDPRALSPFFRIPGFGRTNAIDQFLENKRLITWSADIDTDDWWRGTTPSALIQRTMKRLNAKGRGIILMHDIHPATALALPALLKELKKEGYHVVHVVAAGERPKSLPEVVATSIEKEGWPSVLHAKAEKASAAMSALRHRVKTALTRRGSKRHHYRRTHTADAAIPAKPGDTPAPDRAWRIKPY
jgi:peptidoglycan/xylan/chitin deacetylase (PgdA/CDA1 family)